MELVQVLFSCLLLLLLLLFLVASMYMVSENAVVLVVMVVMVVVSNAEACTMVLFVAVQPDGRHNPPLQKLEPNSEDNRRCSLLRS